MVEVIIEIFIGIARLFLTIISSIWNVMYSIFATIFGLSKKKSYGNKIKGLHTLRDQIADNRKYNAELLGNASDLMASTDPKSIEHSQLKGLIDYCQEVEGTLKADAELLDNDIASVTIENLETILVKNARIKKYLRTIKYPLTQNDLEQISRQNTSGSRFIDTLLKFAMLDNITKTSEHDWIYKTSNLSCTLHYDEPTQTVTITARPDKSVSFIDNPRHPWQYIEPQTPVYFNRDHKLEYGFKWKLSEIDHYDVAEMPEYINRLIANPNINPYAGKNTLAFREAEYLDCNVFPEIDNKRLMPTSPPPAEFMADNEKMHGGRQRWAQINDLERAGMLKPEGFIIGKMGYGSYIYTGKYDSHILTIASVGSGKGVGVVIPNLLRHPGSAIILDPKGENLITTGKKRGQLGNKVFYYDPWNVIDFYNNKFGGNVVPNAIKAKINPLDFIEQDDDELVDKARILASALILRDKQDDAFFHNGAENLLTQLIVYLCTFFPKGNPNRNLIYLRTLLSKSRNTLLEAYLKADYKWLKDKGGTPHRLFTELINQLQESINTKNKAFNDIFTFVRQATEFITSDQVASSLNETNFNVMELKSELRSLYLILDMNKLLFVGDVYRPLVRLIITTCMLGVSSRTIPKHKVLFMLDEIAQLGNLKYLPNLMSIYRAQGAMVWTIWQNIEQIKKNYPDDWEGMLGNCDVQQFFGVNDQTTAELVSKAAGNTTIYKEAYATTEGQTRGETIANTYSNQSGWSTANSVGTSKSNTYQGFNFSMTSGDSKSISDTKSGGNSYAFSRSIQISTSHTNGRTLTKEAVPLITPYEVKSSGAYGVQFVFCKKCAFPILSGKIRYYQDMEFYGEATENLTIKN